MKKKNEKLTLRDWITALIYFPAAYAFCAVIVWYLLLHDFTNLPPPISFAIGGGVIGFIAGVYSLININNI